jgi:hypothetical protein
MRCSSTSERVLQHETMTLHKQAAGNRRRGQAHLAPPRPNRRASSPPPPLRDHITYIKREQ